MDQQRFRTVVPGSIVVWTPWWFRPSAFLLGISLPALLILSFSDYSMTLSRARLFYGNQELVLGVLFLIILALFARLGESNWLRDWVSSVRKPSDRLAEQFFTERVDWVLMGIFLLAHLIFFRGFFTNPGLIAGVLGGNLELKHSFKTIPGVTTWTQVTMVLAAIRGMRWSGILPGNVRLFSLFHIVLFGTLFVRALLWSERLALIEAIIPFAVCALPRLAGWKQGRLKVAIQFFPLIAPILLMVFFVVFESFRSWKAYSGEFSGVFQFGWRRLFTYYFEAMNTGAAILQSSGFYSELTLPTSEKAYDSVYDGLYQKGILDIEFNNPSGIWYLCFRTGSLLIFPCLVALGIYLGWVWRMFKEGRLSGLIFPINIILLTEIIRIYYWPLSNRAIPSTLVFVLIIAWSLTVARRLRVYPAN